MMPVSRGGSDDLENLALACGSCNSRKHSKTAEEYLLWLLRGHLEDLDATECRKLEVA